MKRILTFFLFGSLLMSCGVRKPVTKATITNGAEGTTSTITISVSNGGNTEIKTTPSISVSADSTKILSE